MNVESERFLKRTTDAAIRIGLIALLTVWCLRILAPFLSPVLWGIILAVALAPLHAGVARFLGGRNKLAAASLILAGLAMLLIPATLTSISLLQSAHKISVGMEQGTLRVPPAPASVAEWPLVGKDISQVWNLASQDLEETLVRYLPKVADAVDGLVKTAGGVVRDILLFVLSIFIAGILMANGKRSAALARRVGRRVAGKRGDDYVELAGSTMRSVAKGVVGVALIQATASWLGMALVGVPGAPVWALIVLLLAVMQLPPLLVLGPAAVWVFKTDETLPATLFLVWALLISVSDTFLKPLLMGRGSGVPTLVILLGAIGGLVSAGIAGLFVGAVGLAVGYTLFLAWLKQDEEELQPAAEALP